METMKDIFFLEGRDAYFGGTTLDECPYPEGTDGQCGWNKGWQAANQTPEGSLLVIDEKKKSDSSVSVAI